MEHFSPFNATISLRGKTISIVMHTLIHDLQHGPEVDVDVQPDWNISLAERTQIVAKPFLFVWFEPSHKGLFKISRPWPAANGKHVKRLHHPNIAWGFHPKGEDSVDHLIQPISNFHLLVSWTHAKQFLCPLHQYMEKPTPLEVGLLHPKKAKYMDGWMYPSLGFLKWYTTHIEIPVCPIYSWNK